MNKQPGSSLKKAFKIKARDVSDFKTRDRIGGNNLDDLYRFKLRGSSSTQVDIDLSKLKRNADLELYALDRKANKVNKAIGNLKFSQIKPNKLKKNLAEIGRSIKKGKRAESISNQLEPGTYYIRVFSKSSKATRYKLELATSPVNTPPKVQANQGSTVARGDVATLVEDVLQAIDQEDDNQSLVYTLKTIPQGGRLELNGNPLIIGDQFTQQDIATGNLSYTSLGKITQITNNEVNDIASGVSGFNILLNRTTSSGADNIMDPSREIYFYDGQKGRLIQVTNNDLLDVPYGISGSNLVGETLRPLPGLPGITLPYPFLYKGDTGESIMLESDASFNIGFSPIVNDLGVAWHAIDGVERDYEIFFYDFFSNTSTKITQDAVDQVPVGISSKGILLNKIKRQERIGLPVENEQVFWYNNSTQELEQLSKGSGPSAGIGISDSKIAWTEFDGNDLEIFLYDIDSGITTQITDNFVDDVGIATTGLSGSNLVWNRVDGTQTNVFFYNGESGVTKQLTSSNTGNLATGISGSNILWSNFDENGQVDEVFFYNGDTDIVTQVTKSDNSNFAVGISGSKLVWNTRPDGKDMEVFFADFADFLVSDSFAFKVTDSDGLSIENTFAIDII